METIAKILLQAWDALVALIKKVFADEAGVKEDDLTDPATTEQP